MKGSKLQFSMSCILLFISAFLNVYLAFLLQMIIDSTSANSVNALIRSIAITIGFMLVDLSISILSKYSSTKYIQNTLETMKSQRFRFVFALRNSFGQDDARKELSSFSTDIDILERDYAQEKLNIFFYSTQFVMALAAIISISWVMTLAIAVVSLLPVIVPGIFQKRIQNYQDTYSQNASQYAQFVNESLLAKQEITSYDVVQPLTEKHDYIDRKLEESRRKVRFTNSTIGILCSNLGFLSFVTALGFGSYFVIKGQMTFGYMMAAVQLMNSLTNPLNYLVDALTRFKSTKNIAAKFNEKPDMPEHTNKQLLQFKNELTVSNLTFSYNQDSPPVIENISFSLKKGQKTALIGPSGCGKSTIAKILSREITDFDGVITLDGIPIQDIDIKSFRENVRFVRQNATLFTDTIINNILFFKSDYNNRDLKKALSLSRVDSFASSDEAMNRVVNASFGLSGGQIQRIIIARALLRNSPILILDEFTSALDMETSSNIIRDILQIEDITCLVITHQCDERTLAMFDQVIRMS